MLRVRCPKCKQCMLYQPQRSLVSNKSKRCVYCGRTFSVSSHIVSKVVNG